MITDYQKEHIESCIKTMEDACVKAHATLNDSSDALDAVDGILHDFSWAWANASTGLSTAIRSVYRDAQREAIKKAREGGS